MALLPFTGRMATGAKAGAIPVPWIGPASVPAAFPVNRSRCERLRGFHGYSIIPIF